jgi:hypothetical protein
MRVWLVLALAVGCQGPGAREPLVTLGQMGLGGYHLLAGGASTVPDGDIGFAIAADASGGYSLRFIGAAGSTATFAGTLTTDQAFNPNDTTKLSGREEVAFSTDARIDFSGMPQNSVEGVAFAVETQPLYCDLTVDGKRSGFQIWFTGAHTGLVQASALNPVAFTSP